MSYSSIARRVVVVVLCAACFLAVAVPWSLYWLGLYGAGGTPEPPVVLAPREQQLAAWQRARGKGPPAVVPLNPYTYWGVAFLSDPRPASAMVAWQVARKYIVEHQRYPGMLWWHLSGAALTIWLTRNWSIEQLLTQASQSHAG